MKEKYNLIEKPKKKMNPEASFEAIVSTALKLPGVKVDRRTFLEEMFLGDAMDIEKIIEVGPVEAGCPQGVLRSMANKIITRRTSESSIASFAAGLPGGLAMAATIPADTLQYYGVMLRMAQELTYLYGAKDLWKDGELDPYMVKGHLVLYCGAMFGVVGAAAGVRLFLSQMAKQIAISLAQQVLTKMVWYPVVKHVGRALGVQVTKNVIIKGMTKMLPLVSGAISGGLTFATMGPMGARLAKVLDEAMFEYSEQKALEDYRLLEDLAKQQKLLV